ncbi:MAG: YidC/Oxa1 family insertase periplasmic-domain containing protein [bacterium]
MNNRFFLALVLTAIVIVVTPLLFPSTTKRPAPVLVDTTAHRVDSVQPATQAKSVPPEAPILQPAPSVGSTPATTAAVPETSTVRSSLTTYQFSSGGAVPTSIVLNAFPSHRSGPGDQGCRTGRGAPAKCVELVGPGRALVSYRLALARDTISLDTIVFRGEQSTAPAQGVRYAADIAGHATRITYAVSSDTAASYLVKATVSVADAPPGSSLIVRLPQTLLANEADTVDDINHLAVSFRPARGEVTSVAFSKLDSVEARSEAGPINWIATRNKYFLVALRAEHTPFSAVRLLGSPRVGKLTTGMRGAASMPLGSDGTASFDLYSGPQDFERLQHLGGDLDQVNPYAGFLHGVVQPFANVVMKALLWMKRTTHLNYGWVLVLFGVLIRLILWPLNQGAMRTSMKMQRLQPELQALQKKHKDDPKKQQEAVMKVYKDHGMSPLSPLMGCLPMLLPMPVLYALYYVFQNTIEFRGVSFLWLADISLRDPFYITPLLMGISMFVMSWIGMRNSPPNPQAKMMSYMMPVMLTVLFLNFASGLNLYYAVQNLAAIPQQWLLARERGKQAPVPSASLSKRRT